jgi:hypothetical protein
LVLDGLIGIHLVDRIMSNAPVGTLAVAAAVGLCCRAAATTFRGHENRQNGRHSSNGNDH